MVWFNVDINFKQFVLKAHAFSKTLVSKDFK